MNNAGGSGDAPDDSSLSPEKIDELMFIGDIDANLFSMYRATRSVLPGMCERHYGRIINIGSGYAKRASPFVGYSTAKHAVVGMTRCMAAVVATDGVCINCLCPGWTNTTMVNLDGLATVFGTDAAGAKKRIELESLQQRIIEPEELGPMAVLLASEEGAAITGQVISVDGGYKV